MNTLVTRIKVLMAIHNENARQLSAATGITTTTITNILRNKHGARHDTICLIANHYHVPVDFLLNGRVILSSDMWQKLMG